jgi:hypothetical protein
MLKPPDSSRCFKPVFLTRYSCLMLLLMQVTGQLAGGCGREGLSHSINMICADKAGGLGRFITREEEFLNGTATALTAAVTSTQCVP